MATLEQVTSDPQFAQFDPEAQDRIIRRLLGDTAADDYKLSQMDAPPAILDVIKRSIQNATTGAKERGAEPSFADVASGSGSTAGLPIANLVAQQKKREFDAHQIAAIQEDEEAGSPTRAVGGALAEVLSRLVGAPKAGVDTVANLGLGAMVGDPLANFRMSDEAAHGVENEVTTPSLGTLLADEYVPEPKTIAGGMGRSVVRNAADVLTDPVALGALGLNTSRAMSLGFTGLMGKNTSDLYEVLKQEFIDKGMDPKAAETATDAVISTGLAATSGVRFGESLKTWPAEARARAAARGRARAVARPEPLETATAEIVPEQKLLPASATASTEITVPPLTPSEVPIVREPVNLPALLERSIASTKPPAKTDFGPTAAADTVKVYSGGESGTFWTTDSARAASYGPVREVEVPRSVFEAGKAEAAKLGQPSPNDTVLPNSWVKKATLNPSLKSEVSEITDEGLSLEDMVREFGDTPESEAPSAVQVEPAPPAGVSPAPAAPTPPAGGEGLSPAGLEGGLTARIGGQTVRVGDVLPDGRTVLEIDEATGIPILSRRRQAVAEPPVPKVPSLPLAGI